MGTVTVIRDIDTDELAQMVEESDLVVDFINELAIIVLAQQNAVPHTGNLTPVARDFLKQLLK